MLHSVSDQTASWIAAAIVIIVVLSVFLEGFIRWIRHKYKKHKKEKLADKGKEKEG